MAILKDIQISVVVNDRDLPEFEDDEEEQLPNTVTKYVEAVSNSTFHIKISCLQKPAWYGGTGLCFGVELDGEQVAHPLFRGDQTTSLVKGSSKCINGKWTLQRFKFSDIIIGEHPSEAISTDLLQVVSKIGTITVKVHRKTNIQSIHTPVSYDSSIDPSQPIPEKVLKGQSLSLRACFGAPESRGPQFSVTSDSVDPPSNPYAVFKFKYRSRDALRAMFIIPRSESPPQPLESRPIEELTREELIELVSRRPIPIKPETKPEITPSSRMKRERDSECEELMASARAKNSRVKKEIEVIDLLDD